MTLAAMTHPSQVCTTLILKFWNRNIPRGLLLLNNSSRKNPAAVGGSTSGIVRIPSASAFFAGGNFTTFSAVNMPAKKQIIVAAIPVFKEIYKGLQSKFFKTAMIVYSTSVLK